MEADFDFSVVVIGMSGSGKSAFLNALKNYLEDRSPENFINAFDSNSRTTDIETKLNSEIVISQHNGKRYLLIDTPGLCDTSGNLISKEENAKIILDNLRNLKYINAIIYVNNSTICKVTKEFREAALLMLKFLVADVRKITYSVFTFSSNQLFMEDEDLENDIQKIEKILKFKTTPEKIVKINNIFFNLSQEKIMNNLKAVNMKWNEFKEQKIAVIVQMIERERVETDQYELFEKFIYKIMGKINNCARNYYNLYCVKNQNLITSNFTNKETNKSEEEKRVQKRLIDTPRKKNFYCPDCESNCSEDIGFFRNIGLKLKHAFKSKCNKCNCTYAVHITGSKAYSQITEDLSEAKENNEKILAQVYLDPETIDNIILNTAKRINEIEKIIPEYSVRDIISEIKSIILEELQNHQENSISYKHMIIDVINQLENCLNNRIN